MMQIWENLAEEQNPMATLFKFGKEYFEKTQLSTAVDEFFVGFFGGQPLRFNVFSIKVRMLKASSPEFS